MGKKQVNKKSILIVILTILVIVLIWGLIGASQASPIGMSCDLGMGESLCWFWSENTLGEIGRSVDEFFNN